MDNRLIAKFGLCENLLISHNMQHRFRSHLDIHVPCRP